MTHQHAPAERARFTSSDRRYFALLDLPETVKGALFARYSRSAKTLKALYADEFSTTGEGGGSERADRLYQRVLDGYGDDSVAQLGSLHVACEGVSNVLTKILERGRLMSYLEKSTRYVPLTFVNGRWPYTVPAELEDHHTLARYRAVCDHLFEVYTKWRGPAEAYHRANRPCRAGEPAAAYERALRARALDTLRGLLPAAAEANVGVHGTAQAFSALIQRLGEHPLAEARTAGERILGAVREAAPAFFKNTDGDRGDAARNWLKSRRAAEARFSRTLDAEAAAPTRDGGTTRVELVEHDPRAEAKVLAAAAYPHSARTLGELQTLASMMTAGETASRLEEMADPRGNRRHKASRALEHAEYVFEVEGDYGAFRDLQRHRILTMEWQPLSTRLGWNTPPEIAEINAHCATGADALSDWYGAMDAADRLHRELLEFKDPYVAQYPVPMASRIRFAMRINAREACHMIELRTQPAGHPSYRCICQQMHRLIAEKAGHRGIAAFMKYADHGDGALGRLRGELRTERRNHPKEEQTP